MTPSDFSRRYNVELQHITSTKRTTGALSHYGDKIGKQKFYLLKNKSQDFILEFRRTGLTIIVTDPVERQFDWSDTVSLLCYDKSSNSFLIGHFTEIQAAIINHLAPLAGKVITRYSVSNDTAMFQGWRKGTTWSIVTNSEDIHYCEIGARGYYDHKRHTITHRASFKISDPNSMDKVFSCVQNGLAGHHTSNPDQ